MRVLVTGGRGFAGSHLVRYLLDATAWEIVVADDELAWWRERADQIPRVTQLSVNLTKPLDAWFDDLAGDVDAVFHLAAMSDVQHSIDHPVEHVHTNVDLTLRLLEWARTREITHFIQVSTNEVYGPTPEGGSIEWDPVVPTTPYSASKAAQEALATAWWKTYEVPTVLVNTQHLFGEGQPRRRFIPTVVDRLLREEPVPLFGELNQGIWAAASRRWLHVQNLAAALTWFVVRGRPAAATSLRPDRWHVAGFELDCLGLAQQIADLLGKRLEVEWAAAPRTGYEQRYVLDTTKLETAGWKPPLGLTASLERTVEWAARTHNATVEELA